MERIVVDRIPTQKELEQGFADQVAADYRKYVAHYGGRGVSDVARLPDVDMMKAGPRAPEPMAATTPPAANPARQVIACRQCGQVMTGKTRAAAQMARGRHEKRMHPGP